MAVFSDHRRNGNSRLAPIFRNILMSGNTAVSFTPEVLQSYSRLENFLVGKATTERAISQVVEAGRYPNWSGRWEVSPFLALPYVILIGCAKIASCVLSAIGSKRASLWLDKKVELSSHTGRFYSLIYGEDFLAPSLNQYSPDAIDIYMHPPIATEEIVDERVREIIHPKLTQLEFEKDDGMCRGESFWFLRLYLKTKRLFQNSQQQLRAIGQQFSWGAPAEAALIQKLGLKYEFLRMFITSGELIRDDEADDPSALLQQIVETFQGLQPGAYFLGVPKHSMAYISTGEGQGYLFEPNKGTIAIHDEGGFRMLARIIMSYREDDEESRADWPNLVAIAGVEIEE